MGPLTIIFSIALALSFSVLMLAMRPANTNKSAQQRLRSIRRTVRPNGTGIEGDELTKPIEQGYADRLGGWLARYGFAKRLDVLLVHADSGMGVGSFALTSGGLALGCGVAAYLALSSLALAAVAGVAGGLARYVLLRMKRGRRLKAFNLALPDAIELMARALRAGHAIGASIELIADQSPEPLAGEFAQVHRQQSLGLPFRDTLLQMAARMPSRDLHFLITAILVQKESGGDLTEILDRASHVIRERVRIEGEVRTKTAQGRLTGWILALLPVIMLALINLVSPGYSSMLFHDPTGQKMLWAGGILIVIGGLVIRKVVDVQV